MSDLKEATANVFSKVLDEKLETVLGEKLGKLLDSTITDLFSQYSDFGKEFKKAVAEKLLISAGQINLTPYAMLVNRILEEELNNTLFKTTKEAISIKVNEFVGVIEKKEWRLSEIVNYFKELKPYASEEEYEISYDINNSYGAHWISLDHKGDKEKYDCEHRIWITKEGNIGSFWYKDKGPIEIPGNKFQTFLFKLYAGGAKITIDSVDTEYSTEE